MTQKDCDGDCLSCNTDTYISDLKAINIRFMNQIKDFWGKEELSLESKRIIERIQVINKVEEPTRDDLITFARDCQKYYLQGQEIMRKHNLCIDNLDNPMQKLAFTFYTYLCEIDSKVRHLFQESYGDDNYHDERLPEGVTYSPEHDNEIRNATLDEVILEMVYSKKGFPQNIREFSERIISLRTKEK